MLPFRSPLLAAVIVATLGAWRTVYYLNQPDDVLIGVIPDDAFYYLQLARNRLALGAWTFDGTAPTTGFHPLHAYVLMALRGLLGSAADDWRLSFAVMGFGGAVSFGASAWLVARAATRISGRDAALWTTLAFVTPAAAILPTLLMESQWVVLAGAATVHAVTQGGRVSKVGAWGLFSLGVLGSLARTDFGLLPAAITASILIFANGNRAAARRSGMILIGAVVGVGLTMLQNYAIAGQVLQASARVKLYWASQAGWDLTRPASRLAFAILPFWAAAQPILLALVLIAFAAAGLWGVLSAGRRLGLPSGVEPVGAACLLTLAGYVALYSMNSQALQIWYSAMFVVPVAFLWAEIGARLSSALAVIVALVLVLATFGTTGLSLWPAQSGMLAASQRLTTMPIDHLGSWNAGILGYTSGKIVTNLDGLVNDDVAEHVLRGSVYGYVRSRGIEYLVGYPRDFGRLAEDHGCFIEVSTLAGEAGPPDERLQLKKWQHSCG